MSTGKAIEQVFSSVDLVSTLAALAPKEGGNDGGWAGLTIYRFCEPIAPTWEEVKSLSVGIVAQGSKAVMVGGERYVCDPFHYLVLDSNLHFQAEILQASQRKPFLSFVLQIDPALVKKVSDDMLERRMMVLGLSSKTKKPEPVVVSALDIDLLGAVLRFLHALGNGADRRVLAPMCVQEMVYRVLQREQFLRLLQISDMESSRNPISAALTFVQAHYAEPITVNDLAEQVSLSPSTFSVVFRAVTGHSPYQFLKEFRLNRARELLADGRMNITEVSRKVGYSSVSHFIKEFRTNFGTTPRAYVDTRILGMELQHRQKVVG